MKVFLLMWLNFAIHDIIKYDQKLWTDDNRV